MIRKCCKKLYDAVISCFNYYIKVSKAAMFPTGLICSHSLVEYSILALLITHLTEDRNMGLAKAARIVNAHEGFSSVLVIFMAYIADVYSGRFRMIVFATSVHITGLVVLYVAARILQGIGIKILYGSLVFLTLGKAGRGVLLRAFLADQFRSSDLNCNENEERVEKCRKFWWGCPWFVGFVLALVVVFTVASWMNRCFISAIAMGIGYFWFLLGFAFYNYKIPTKGSSLTTVVRVIKAAILKRHLRYPVSTNQLHTSDGGQTQLLPAIPFSRWLDKAAIRNTSPYGLEVQENESKICTIADVNEVKLIFKMIPMWTTFFVYTLVVATGSTFFFEQYSSMNSQIGSTDGIPFISFLLIRGSASFAASYFGYSVLSKLHYLQTRPQLAFHVQIGIGMMCSILCCIIAWRIEVFRLRTTYLISGFWLLPQFALLGCMEGFAEEGLDEFFKSQVSESMRMYGPAFNDSVLGIGKFISIIFIFIFIDWFGENVNSSRLDKYYAVLGTLTFVNIFFFWYMAHSYGYQQSAGIAQGVEDDNDDLEIELTENVVSPLLLDKSHSHHIRSIDQSKSFYKRSPQSLFQSSGKLLRRFFTITGSDSELNVLRLSIMNKKHEV